MKRMIQLPPFDNNSYVWQGKDWKKINIYSDKNLDGPELIDKEYLGNGEYLIYRDTVVADKYATYNVYSGIWTFNKPNDPVNTGFAFTTSLLNYINNGDNITVSLIEIGGVNNTLGASQDMFIGSIGNFEIGSYRNFTPRSYTYAVDNTNLLSFWSSASNFEMIKYQFKLQIEKGDTATPYTPPAAPVKYYLEHDYEPLTIDGFINYDNKIFSDFKTLKENIKEKEEK